MLWLTSEAAHGRIESALERHRTVAQNRHQAFAVRNETYGGNIIVSGLLMVDDFIKAGRAALGRWPETELVLVPKEPFDQLYRDLKGVPAHRISDELGRPVWVVEGCGCVNPLLDRPFRRKEERALKPLMETMNLFNAAWQEPSRVESSLDLVDAFPLQISENPVSREELRATMLGAADWKEELRRPIHQRFEILDETRALCLENWATEDEARQLSRWTFLVRRNGEWKINRVMTGEVKPGDDACRARC